jgi:hypothetical protein
MNSAARHRRFISHHSFSALGLGIALLCPALLAGQGTTFRSFDAPDAGKQPNQGTVSLSINSIGSVAGFYIDSAGVDHGFFRTTGATVTEFDPPGLVNTFALAINGQMEIVGYGSRTVAARTHQPGFRRSTFGKFAAVDVPGAADTTPYAINDSGQIAGTFSDSAEHLHGFLRNTDGTYTVLDVPDLGSGRTRATTAVAINATGTITGYYADSAIATHGFVRDQFGNYTSFDPPDDANGTFPKGINSSGTITGSYTDSNFGVHSFVRDAAGNITTLDMPGAQQTLADAINDQGVIVGEVAQGSAFAAFRRDSLGTFGLLGIQAENAGSNAFGIAGNRFTGSYIDLNGVSHGFTKHVETQ